MSNNLGIYLDKEKITRGIEELQECKKYLNQVDESIYTGMKALLKTKGTQELLDIDQSIDMTKPEKVIEGCKTDMESLITNIQTNVDLVDKVNKEPSNRYETIQKLRKNLNEQKLSSVDKQINNNIQFRETTEVNEIVTKLEEMDPDFVANQQVLYGPHLPEEDVKLTVNPPIPELAPQALYGPPTYAPEQALKVPEQMQQGQTYSTPQEIIHPSVVEEIKQPIEQELQINIPKPRVPSMVVKNSEVEKSIIEGNTASSIGAAAGFAGVIAATAITSNITKNKNNDDDDDEIE